MEISCHQAEIMVARKWGCPNGFCAVTLESLEVGYHIGAKLDIDWGLQKGPKGMWKANIPIFYEMNGLI